MILSLFLSFFLETSIRMIQREYCNFYFLFFFLLKFLGSFFVCRRDRLGVDERSEKSGSDFGTRKVVNAFSRRVRVNIGSGGLSW